MYLIDFKKDNKSKDKIIGTAAVLGGSKIAIESGIPRLLGVRLESHSTGRKTANAILNSGGYIDPNYSGSSSLALLNGKRKIENSRNKVFITGIHPDKKTIPFTGLIEKPVIRQIFRARNQLTKEDALNTVDIEKKLLKLKKGSNMKSTLKFINNLFNPIQNRIGGKTLYTGGSDDFFRKNFVIDPDLTNSAMASSKPVKVYSNRFQATKAAIKNEGLLNLMSKNKSRVLGGLLLTGGGLAVVRAGLKRLTKKKKRPKFLNGYKK